MTNSISTENNQQPLRIAIVIYPDAEVLDFAGPYEVFTTAVRVHQFNWQVQLVAETAMIKARAGFMVQSHATFADAEKPDILVVVGGDHTREVNNPVLLAWIKQASASTKIVASVCTGAFLLAEAGIVDTHNMTTHWEDIADLRRLYPSLTVHENCRVVNQGTLYSSGGISAGIDMALTLVADITKKTDAEATARQMEYRWDDSCLRV
ncbi:DJ-1/PfpI family protein [Alteromonas sp. RKMC-009]|uniref:DJ-1/PfpI family protein n=1 Tax=Alteromonas sp. RKMC-009 TaxID=2267264 RepID=UPI001E5BADF7|nr:DJ-1/PfpI family protein [Alteromonas sp. RKMC-009]MEC7692091.1 DJ-1/PfpI family protein [Pseudomonadota bacterium]